MAKSCQKTDIRHGTAAANNAQDTLERVVLFLILSHYIQICGYKDVPASEAVPRRARPNGIVRTHYLSGKY